MEPKISELETQRLQLLKDAEALTGKPDATAEELAEADKKLDEAEKLAAQIKVLKSQDHRKKRIETAKLAIAAAAAVVPATLATLTTPTIPGNDGASELAKLPAIPKSYGQLRAFKGADAEKLAFGFGAYCVGLTNHELAPECRKIAESLGFSYSIGGRAALAMGTASDDVGGHLVQAAVGDVIRYLRLQYSVMRKYAEIEDMTGIEKKVAPVWKTGLRVYPAVEGATRTQSTPTTGEIELITRDWAIMSLFSNKLANLTSAIMKLGDDLASDMGYQFALNEDTCCFNGDGTSTYQGIQGIAYKLAQSDFAGSLAQAASGNTTFGTLDLADFIAVQAKLPNFAGIMPAWFIHKAGWAASMQPLAISTGMLSAADGVNKTFLGDPVVFVEVLPKALTSLASQIGCLYGDMRLAAKFGDAPDVGVKTSTERYFDSDQTAVKGESRFAFNAHRLGTDTVAGPMIALQFAAS